MRLGSNHIWNPTNEEGKLEFWLQHYSGITEGEGIAHWARWR